MDENDRLQIGMLRWSHRSLLLLHILFDRVGRGQRYDLLSRWTLHACSGEILRRDSRVIESSVLVTFQNCSTTISTGFAKWLWYGGGCNDDSDRWWW